MVFVCLEELLGWNNNSVIELLSNPTNGQELAPFFVKTN